MQDAVNVTKLLFLDAHQLIYLLSLSKKSEQEGHNVICEMLSGIWHIFKKCLSPLSYSFWLLSEPDTPLMKSKLSQI